MEKKCKFRGEEKTYENAGYASLRKRNTEGREGLEKEEKAWRRRRRQEEKRLSLWV
jgi:hypothetical protein